MRWYALNALGLSMLVASCGTSPRPSDARAPTDASSRRGLTGDVLAPAGSRATGRLVLTWRTPGEQREVTSGQFTLTLVRRMVGRMNVSDHDIDLAKTPRVPYGLPEAPADAVPVAIFDVEHTFWETFLGGGKGFVGTGTPGGALMQLAPNPAPSGATRERCEGERYKLVIIEDEKLGKRRFCAYLPASWKANSSRLYPVVLLLPGFGSSEMSYLTGRLHAGERLDMISREMSREAVLVGVDTSVPLGSTYLEDSPVMGPWDTFLAKKALPILERELRLLPTRTGRALMGQSTGGYNSLSFGMRHSDLVSAIGASSPDAPDVEAWLFEPGTRHTREWIRRWASVEAAVGGAGQFTSWAANWSLDSTAPRGFRYPIDVNTGVPDEPVLAQWIQKTPHGLLRNPEFRARVQKDLSGRMMIIVGKNDDFELFAPAERFANELSQLGIQTRFVATKHGHAGHLERFEPTLRFLLEKLDSAK